MARIERVETVDGRVYYSTDGWETVWKIAQRGLKGRPVKSKKEADLARFLAVVAHGGGRDDCDEIREVWLAKRKGKA